MTTTRIFQAAAVIALTLVLGTPALASAATAAPTAVKPPVTSTNDMGWQ
ncbi:MULTISPECIES: hypothetical protein [Streptomyces]|nr:MULTISPECIES: hypothetical protein [Streptomyces]GLX18376.1 hypothetical protein Slala01_20200 [Streptomyces lavendulae subsp. lavendulae]GLX28699.1 hypothetical protein Slala02_45190 [Streptomyces lavendulae subsp. lavendulae]